MSIVRDPAETKAAEWHASLPWASEYGGPGAPFQLRHFLDTPPEVDQPILFEDVICLHQGGAKRVVRSDGLHTGSHDVAAGALTLMPRRRGNRWRTIGPIDYVHLVLGPEQVATVAGGEFGCDRAGFDLDDDVGFRDPLLELLLGEMLRVSRERTAPGRLYLESLVTTFLVTLLRTRSTIAARCATRSAGGPIRGGLGGWRLRRVTAYLDTHLAEDIGIDTLTELTGLSRAQFFRAFRQSTGLTPSRYLEWLRVERAKPLIAAGEAAEIVARQVGIASARGLTSGFRRHLGISPAHYRRWSR